MSTDCLSRTVVARHAIEDCSLTFINVEIVIHRHGLSKHEILVLEFAIWTMIKHRWLLKNLLVNFDFLINNHRLSIMARIARFNTTRHEKKMMEALKKLA